MENLTKTLLKVHDTLESFVMLASKEGSYVLSREMMVQLAESTLAEVKATILQLSLSSIKTNELCLDLPSVSAAAALYNVYTDGACKGNPGPAGWGVTVSDGHSIKEASGFIGMATNQIAELQAAIEGLQLTPEGANVKLFSDSQYVLKGISEWRAGWERNNWQTSTKKPVQNKSYWVKLFALVDARKVSTQWVKGHSGDHMNERCDELATQAIVRRANA